jgi:hypothetical protein
MPGTLAVLRLMAQTSAAFSLNQTCLGGTEKSCGGLFEHPMVQLAILSFSGMRARSRFPRGVRNYRVPGPMSQIGRTGNQQWSAAGIARRCQSFHAASGWHHCDREPTPQRPLMQSQVEITTIREFESGNSKRGGARNCEPVCHVRFNRRKRLRRRRRPAPCGAPRPVLGR